ncbi:hypothetical protein EZV61_03045 [Corallincola luteus]|uniref:TIR domain-containing protein n=1 Tax=Corallincola luteus TaxID=1775177 RepID=A0ABY2AP37_9GAMM|nr:hypothetical protein [Corallincola luteus]TCI04955.1 hypothetical protein EZV61_03045 [Corallincola luteus]
MSPIAPNIILFYDHDALAVIVDDIERHFSDSPLFDSGYRISRLDNRGQGKASLADIKDAGMFMLLSIDRQPEQEAAPRKRSLTESALYQHLSVGAQRLVVPVLDVKLRAKNAEHDTLADPSISTSAHYHLRPLVRSAHSADEIIQDIERILGKHLDSHEQVLQNRNSLLNVAGLTPDTDATGNPLLARQLAVIFGNAPDPADDEQLLASSDGANLKLNLRWAMRNLGFGHRKGAIANLRRIVSLDDGHLTANFWLSRLLSESNRDQGILDEANTRSKLLLSQLEQYHNDYHLLRSLGLLHQSRASFHLHQHDECQRQLRMAMKLDPNRDVLAETVRRTLQKIIRDGDIRLSHNDDHVELAVDALKILYVQDHSYYYRTVRALSESFSPELVSQLTRQLDIRIQKEVSPLFRSENQVTLFCTDELSKPLLAAREAKPLPSWQQYELSKDSALNQLTLLQQIARHQQSKWQQLKNDEQRLKLESQQAALLPDKIDQGLAEMKDCKQSLSSTRLATISSVVLAVISVTLFWFPALSTQLASVPFVICFILSALFAIQWRRHSERKATYEAKLRDAVAALSNQLEAETHPNLTTDGLFQRLDFLASQLREHVAEESRECNERRQHLHQQTGQFMLLADTFESSLTACDNKFNPFVHNQEIRWQPLALMADACLMPPELQAVRESHGTNDQGLCTQGSGEGLNRWSVYFEAQIDEQRWQRLQSQEKLAISQPNLRPIIMPSVDNIINFKAKTEEIH